MTSRLSPVFQFKAADVSATGEFAGYASTFGGPPDSYGDVIIEGAFSKSLAAHKSANTWPALLWSHNPSAPIGKWVSMAEDSKGLAVTGRLTLAVKQAAEAHALMRDNALGLSIGFKTIDDDFTNDGTHLLKQIDLWEVSAVAMPANSRAQIVSVRSKPGTLRDYELALRESLRFNGREARQLATRGWSALNPDEPDADAELVERLHALELKL